MEKVQMQIIMMIILTWVVRLLPIAVVVGVMIAASRKIRQEIRAKSAQAQQAAVPEGASALPPAPPLGQQLRQLREAKGMTQEMLAVQLGVSRQAVSKWENGAAEPSTANLLALATLYGVSVDELLRGQAQ